MKSAAKSKRERVQHSLQIDPKPITITHVCKVRQSVTICSDSRLSAVSFMPGYARWLRQTLHRNFPEPSSVYQQTCTYMLECTSIMGDHSSQMTAVFLSDIFSYLRQML